MRLLSLCAGQGRDVTGALADHRRRNDVTGRLVELDPDNAGHAAAGVEAKGLDLEVMIGDAGSTDACAGAVPVDVLLLCGIFGNITDADVEHTVRSVPMLLAPDAVVIWTRHRAEPDLTPMIRDWFAAAGFEELAFEGPMDLKFGVGANRLVRAPDPFEAGVRLFSFV